MDKYIKEYLLTHEKVQINGFGRFEIVYKSAEIHPVLHTVTVPGKYVVFSENTAADATELTNFIASKEQLSVEETNNRISEWVETVKDTINQKKEYLLAFGKFLINAMGKIEFIPSLDADISPESFGLEAFTMPVKSAPKSNQAQEEIVDASSEEKNTIPQTQKKPKRRRDILLVFLLLVLAIVLAAGIICYLYPQDVKKHTQELFSLFKKEQKQPAEDTKTTIFEDNTEENIQIQPTERDDLQENTAIEPEPEPEPIIKEETPIPTENYYVVIGSFRSETNAQNFIAQKQKDYPNIVNLGKGQNTGLHTIGIGPYTKEDAEKQIRNGLKGWWLVRK